MSRVPTRTAMLTRHRDRESCVRCGIFGGNIHHRRMRSQSPKAVVHNVENLLLLCGSGTTGCHGWVHAHPSVSYERGWLVRSYNDPTEVPVWYAPDGDLFYLTDRGTRIRKKAAS